MQLQTTETGASNVQVTATVYKLAYFYLPGKILTFYRNVLHITGIFSFTHHCFTGWVKGPDVDVSDLHRVLHFLLG